MLVASVAQSVTLECWFSQSAAVVNAGRLFRDIYTAKALYRVILYGGAVSDCYFASLLSRKPPLPSGEGQYRALVQVFADIDFINLVGRKKSPGILEVDPVPDEQLKTIPVNVVV